MSQAWADNVFQGDHDVATDMQNIETNFAALRSLFSGSGAPAAVAGQPWFDSNKKLLKIRNAANSAWLGVMAADTAHKLWVYRNSAPDGWVIDASVADVVLAIKGGSRAYSRTGGGTAGTWTQPGHTLTVDEMPSHDHGGTNVSGNHNHNCRLAAPGSTGNPALNNPTDAGNGAWQSSNNFIKDGSHSHTIQSQGGGASHNHGSTYRPAAAVGTLQRLDI